MEIGSSPLAQQQLGSASQSGAKLAQDFDTFLSLLTTQLQNQDPLEPLDSNEFTAQLVQFTGVEQSIATNKNLETLVSLLSAQSENGLFSYIGQSATALSSGVNLNGDNQPEWIYDLGANVPEAKLVVTNASGVKVAEFDGATEAGRHSFTWDGRNEFGNRLPDGRYNLEVKAETVQGTAVGVDVFVRGTVQGIERTPNGALLSLDGSFVTPAQITSVGDLHQVDTRVTNAPPSDDTTDGEADTNTEEDEETTA